MFTSKKGKDIWCVHDVKSLNLNGFLPRYALSTRTKKNIDFDDKTLDLKSKSRYDKLKIFKSEKRYGARHWYQGRQLSGWCFGGLLNTLPNCKKERCNVKASYRHGLVTIIRKTTLWIRGYLRRKCVATPIARKTWTHTDGVVSSRLQSGELAAQRHRFSSNSAFVFPVTASSCCFIENKVWIPFNSNNADNHAWSLDVLDSNMVRH